MSLQHKTFAMSMYMNKADLYEAKAEHYMNEAEKLQMEVVVLEAKLNRAADVAETLTKVLEMETGVALVKEAFAAE